mgnify:CR=1 FL=1
MRPSHPDFPRDILRYVEAANYVLPTVDIGRYEGEDAIRSECKMDSHRGGLEIGEDSGVGQGDAWRCVRPEEGHADFVPKMRREHHERR